MNAQFPGAAAQWLAREYEGSIQEAESQVATAAAIASAAGNDPDAIALTFVNFGTFDILLSLRADPPAGFGIKLLANGGSVSLTLRDDLTLVTREWFARSPGGASSLYVLRLRRFAAIQEQKP